VLGDTDPGATGTWLQVMADGLIASGEVDFANICEGPVAQCVQKDFDNAQQWTVPCATGFRTHGLPSRYVVAQIEKIIEGFAPDLIHVWGTEGCWGLLTARRVAHVPVLLGMQGLKTAIGESYSGDLSYREMMKCAGIKEFIKWSMVPCAKKRFCRWGEFEREMISKHKYVATQSSWMEAQVRAISADSTLFHNDRALRKPFYTAKPWVFSGNPIVFFLAAYPAPFKGLHVAVRAVAILKGSVPGIHLRIAGLHPRTGVRRDGYVAWVLREIRRLRLESDVTWLDSLSAVQIVDELQQCSALVVPSFIESYCVVLAEAMILGVPAAVSYTGGMASLARDEESALFFSPGDSNMCAYQLERLLTDRDLAEKISDRARDVALVRNDYDRIIRRQIEIYRRVIDSGNSVGRKQERVAETAGDDT